MDRSKGLSGSKTGGEYTLRKLISKQSVKNMADHTKVGLYDIMLMTSFNPAHYIHADDCKGSIRPGMDADLTIMDQNLDLICVYCRGKEIRE